MYGIQVSPTDENTKTNPDTAYGRSKLAAEKVIEHWVREDLKRQVVIIKPTIVFVPENYANMYN